MLLKYFLHLEKKNNQEAGFTIPLVLGFGLFMLAVGIASIRLSSDSEINSKVQTKTQQAIAAAELGIARIQEELSSGNNRALAVAPDCAADRTDDDGDGFFETCPDLVGDAEPSSWNNPNAIPGAAANPLDCDPQSGNPVVPASLSNTLAWTDADPTDPSKGQYRLVSYEYNTTNNDPTALPTDVPGNATLTIEGRTNQGITGAGNTDKAINTGISRIQVNIPILDGSGLDVGGFPGLWMNTGSDNSILTNKVDGNIVFAAPFCDITATPPNTGLPPEANINQADNIVQVGGEFTGDIRATKQVIPDTPALPPDESLNFLQSDELFGDSTRSPAILPTELPRPTDIQYKGAYHYLIPSLIMDETDSINLRPNTNIVFYVQGDITFYGQVNDGDVPVSQFQIYGNVTESPGRITNEEPSGTGYKYGCDQNVDLDGVPTPNKCATNKIEFDDSADVDAFIHAPQAWGCLISGTGGTPSTEPSLTGAMWIFQWADANQGGLVTLANASSGTDITNCNVGGRTIVQFDDDLADNNEDILGALTIPADDLPILSPVSAWEIRDRTNN
ncbi:hypothetical protein NIES208_17070 [[Limnothrix rosea] IAM M-220]|nr:hypothetical protein NIES208_17070 [[Limnothrix rosea] IAM M-220]